MTLLFFLILAALPPVWREPAFELIVLMDPSFMGFFFAGGMVLLTSLFEPIRGTGEMIAAVAGLVLWNVIAYCGAKRSFGRLADQAGPAPPGGLVAGRRRRLRAGPDARLLLRDPVHLMVLAGPLLAAVVLGSGIPWILSEGGPGAAFIPASAAAELLRWMDHVRSFVLLLGVLMYGMLGGLLILDEKDAGVIPFMRTSPGPRGAGGVCALAACGCDDSAGRVPLTLGTCAQNKVQGLAMAKVLNFLVLPPLLMIALPGRFHWLLGLIPTAWGSLMRLSAENPLQVGLAAAAGTVYAVGLLAVLYRRAMR